MHCLQRHRRLAYWTMLLALVVAALAPAVSRALALSQAGRAPWSTVCSADRGVRPGSPPADRASVFDHCPYCALASDLPMVPAAPQVPLIGARGADALSAGLLAPLGYASVWCPAQPRAPPAAG